MYGGGIVLCLAVEARVCVSVCASVCPYVSRNSTCMSVYAHVFVCARVSGGSTCAESYFHSIQVRSDTLSNKEHVHV